MASAPAVHKSHGVGHSDIGQRDRNEDAYHVDDRVGLYLVADGVGGYAGGGVASRVAVRAVAAFYERVTSQPSELAEDSLEEGRLDLACRLANREVGEHKTGLLVDMATTLTALRLYGRRAVVANIGDSRVYRLRDGQLSQLTADHSLRAELAAEGDFVLSSGASQMLTRAIGIPGASHADVWTYDAQRGDVYLLCTDGLSNALPQERMSATLEAFDPDFACATLVGEALGAGARDNVTAVVVSVR